MLCEDLPGMVERSLVYANLDRNHLAHHLAVSEDADAARARLPQLGLCAFVADGSILPRRSGIDDRPLDGGVPFRSPPSLSVTLDLPHAGRVSGMGIPRGVTLIVGGGYHGKSTLLRALERGVYNHVPGDGRERVVTDPTAIKIRAEDGRSIASVDISPFITNLPDGTDTTVFSTRNASGSTSQAASIVEALQADSRLLLLDEDTCATNFMIRDRRMQELVAKESEPITPFIDRVRELYETCGASSILVMGGSGDYFDVADTVVLMQSYLPRDVTPEARRIAGAHQARRSVEVENPLRPFRGRSPVRASIDASAGRREVKVGARGRTTILFGRHDIDVSAVEQFVDGGQLLAVGQALHVARERFMEAGADLTAIARRLDGLVAAEGLDALDPRRLGTYVRVRPQEFLAALNRLRELRVKPL
jgi:predicted ABC-class ATPase